MAEQPEQLEKELGIIWRNAPNTRKHTVPKRIDAILERSRAELSLRDLLIFFIYLGQACFMLSVAVIQALFSPKKPARQHQGIKK